MIPSPVHCDSHSGRCESAHDTRIGPTRGRIQGHSVQFLRQPLVHKTRPYRSAATREVFGVLHARLSTLDSKFTVVLIHDSISAGRFSQTWLAQKVDVFGQIGVYGQIIIPLLFSSHVQEKVRVVTCGGGGVDEFNLSYSISPSSEDSRIIGGQRVSGGSLNISLAGERPNKQ